MLLDDMRLTGQGASSTRQQGSSMAMDPALEVRYYTYWHVPVKYSSMPYCHSDPPCLYAFTFQVFHIWHV